MPVFIPDEVLEQANLSERDALIEIACRLYDAGRLTFRQADRLAGLSRDQMEHELRSRGLAVFRYTPDMFQQDLATIDFLGPEGAGGNQTDRE